MNVFQGLSDDLFDGQQQGLMTDYYAVAQHFSKKDKHD